MPLKDWIGRSETLTDVVTLVPCAALAATLDRTVTPRAGEPLPPLWHWLYFLPIHRQSELGPDGHARRGEFLPPVDLPRRMWAGSAFEFLQPIHVGDALTRTSAVVDVQEKSGRSGALVFVAVEHVISRVGDSAPVLRERHDIVYRAAPPADAPPPQPVAPPAAPAWVDRVVPDDVLLFRYSALTFNGHRIHYDRRYATTVEAYPGLVVHGPLLATLLLESLHRARPGVVLRRFAFRMRQPVFDGVPIDVCGAPQGDGDRLALWISDARGAVCLDGVAEVS